MPEMDGVAFRSEQKTVPDCADTPVVIVSGREDGQEVASSLGACDLLKKPVPVSALLAAVEQHCARSQSKR